MKRVQVCAKWVGLVCGWLDGWIGGWMDGWMASGTSTRRKGTKSKVFTDNDGGGWMICNRSADDRSIPGRGRDWMLGRI